MQRKTEFVIGEWYHCYTRGVEKRKTFLSQRDYERFTELLYLCNTTPALHRSNISQKSHSEIFAVKRKSPLVAIGTYALMPNHFHILIQEIIEDGISTFMQKLGTAYTMYFNMKNERTGPLFVGPFRSKHIPDDRYFTHVAQYIHLNPAELFEPDWKIGKVRDIVKLEHQLRNYPHSSFPDYHNQLRPEKTLLNDQAFTLIQQSSIPLPRLLKEMSEFYLEHS